MLLDKVKLSLQITSNSFDDEINDLIESCKHDLKLSGVNYTFDSDPLFVQAAKLYCKAHFGDNDSNEKFLNSYYALKISMSLSGDYANG